MILWEIDSAGIQELIQTGAGLGVQLLPQNFQILAPAISSVLTILTAAVIRYFEKRRIEKERKRELQDIVKIYLLKDKEELSKKISELQKRSI